MATKPDDWGGQELPSPPHTSSPTGGEQGAGSSVTTHDEEQGVRLPGRRTWSHTRSRLSGRGVSAGGSAVPVSERALGQLDSPDAPGCTSPLAWTPGLLLCGPNKPLNLRLRRPRKGMAEAAGPLPQTSRHTARAQGPAGCWGGTGPLSHLIPHLAQGCQPPSQPPGQKPGLPQPADREATTSLPPGLTSTPTQPTWPSSPGLPRHMAGLLPCPTCPPVLQRQPGKASTGLQNPWPGLRGL